MNSIWLLHPLASPVPCLMRAHCTFSGQCQDCDGAILRHIRVGALSSASHHLEFLTFHSPLLGDTCVQINGSRLGDTGISGGGNIEMGGSNAGQLVEYVKSFDPRSWTCLHIMEGALDCTNATVRYNDIGE